jgi:hypothetical protein
MNDCPRSGCQLSASVAAMAAAIGWRKLTLPVNAALPFSRELDIRRGKALKVMTTGPAPHE